MANLGYLRSDDHPEIIRGPASMLLCGSKTYPTCSTISYPRRQMSGFRLCSPLSQFRFRYLEKPAQFGGTDCMETLWDSLACPRATEQCLVPDYCGDSFTCKETGRFRQERWDRTLPFALKPARLTVLQAAASANPCAAMESQTATTSLTKMTARTSTGGRTNVPP